MLAGTGGELSQVLSLRWTCSRRAPEECPDKIIYGGIPILSRLSATFSRVVPSSID
jgi:hypothetical protein